MAVTGMPSALEKTSVLISLPTKRIFSLRNGTCVYSQSSISLLFTNRKYKIKYRISTMITELKVAPSNLGNTSATAIPRLSIFLSLISVT